MPFRRAEDVVSDHITTLLRCSVYLVRDVDAERAKGPEQMIAVVSSSPFREPHISFAYSHGDDLCAE
jgi:hypothetical protein